MYEHIILLSLCIYSVVATIDYAGAASLSARSVCIRGIYSRHCVTSVLVNQSSVSVQVFVFNFDPDKFN